MSTFNQASNLAGFVMPPMRQDQPWTLLDTRMKPIVQFTSFIDLQVRDKGHVATAAIEMGSFAAYNKTQIPKELVAKLACQGEPDEINQIINRLQRLKVSTEMFSVVTPFQEYQKLTLKDLDYAHTQKEGASMLVVTLTMTEIREFESDSSSSVVSLAAAKNKELTSLINYGKKQGTEVPLARVYI